MDLNQRIQFDSIIVQYISLKNGYWDIVKFIFKIHNIPLPNEPQEPDIVMKILKKHFNNDHVVPGN
jgi:hypothetical protein